MALPPLSIRAKPEHREILQKVAELLREGGEKSIREFLSDQGTRPIGNFRNEKSALSFLTGKLGATLRPRQIWLFGSRARGDARADSDFDLLVVMPDGSPIANDYGAARAPIDACGLGVDVIPCSWSDFVKARCDRGTISWRAFTEGKLLYQDRQFRQADRK
jgi:predicted nucleotidyltransferase